MIRNVRVIVLPFKLNLDFVQPRLINNGIFARPFITAPTSVSAPSKALFFGRPLAGIAGSKAAGGMDFCLF